MYVSLYVGSAIGVYTHILLLKKACLFLHISPQSATDMHVNIYIYIYIYIYNIYIYTHTHTYTYIYTHTYTHTHIHTYETYIHTCVILSACFSSEAPPQNPLLV
jgi:hypothetical protein